MYSASLTARLFVVNDTEMRLQKDVIVLDSAEWATTDIVLKTHGSLKFCVDYFKLN